MATLPGLSRSTSLWLIDGVLDDPVCTGPPLEDLARVAIHGLPAR